MKPRRTARAAVWSSVGTAAEFVGTLVALLVTSRLVRPAEFGIYAGWLAIAMVASEATTSGFRYRGVLTESTTASGRPPILSARVWVATAVAASVSVLAARAIGREDDQVVVLVLSAIIPLRSAYARTEGELQARMQFRLLGLVQSSGAALYLVTSIALAQAWRNAEALAVAQLSVYVVPAFVLSTIGAARVRAQPLAARVDQLSRRDVAAGMAISVQSALLVQLDNVIVAARLGAAALGLYSRAYRLSVVPARVFSDAIGTVLFPLFARHAGEHDTRRMLDVGDAVSLVVVLPYSCAVAVFSRDLLRFLLGEEWTSGAAAMAILSLALAPQVQTKILQSAVLGRGDLSMTLRNSTFRLGVLIAAALVGASWGISGVAAGVALAFLAGYVRMRIVAKAGFATSTLRYTVAASVLTAALMGLGWIVRQVVATWYLGLVIFVPLAVLTAAAAGLRMLGPNLTGSLGRPRRLPDGLARILGFA